jgi:hypothetical protein
MRGFCTACGRPHSGECAEMKELKMTAKIDEAKAYLADGGLGEVIGLTSMAIQSGQPKVQMDADMAMALCLLADETLKRRAAH